MQQPVNTVQANFFRQAGLAERGQRDYRLDAVLDLAEFTNIMISSVLHYNHHSRRPDRLTADMIREELEPSPINLWRWGMENGLATPNTQPHDLVYLHLLPRDTASIQRGGICFKGMYYTCAYAIEQNWFARARRDGRRSVPVWYDPNDTTHVWLQDSERNFVRCDLLASEERVVQRRLEEVLDMLEVTGSPTGESTYAALNDRIRLDAHIGSVVGQAQMDKRAARPATPVPVSGQAADIKKHRAFEKAAERQRPETPPGTGQHAATMSTSVISPAASSVAEAYAGELGLLGQLREKGKRS